MKGLTELVFILDRSGSMCGLERDTIGGFNSLIEKQKKNEGQVYVSTVLFNSRSKVLHDRVPLDKIKPMTENDYNVGGCTALLDAVGHAINHIGNVHKYARPEDRPEKTLFVITTDGMENSSVEYSYKQIKSMIERQEKKYDWEFIFLGANIDAVDVAESIGIRASNAANYHADEEGTALNYRVLNDAISDMRAAKCCSLPSDWKRNIDCDYKKRKKR